MTSTSEMRSVACMLAMLLVLAPAHPAHAAGQVYATFTGQGPAAIKKDGDTTGISPMAGAVRAIVTHPTNPDVVWIGSVNGGIWKTTNATSSSPDWTPLSSEYMTGGSLSIGAMEMDPTSTSNDVLVAAFGRASAFPDENGTKVSGKLAGILRTTDGGLGWVGPIGESSLTGQNIDAVVPRGSVILVASKSADSESPGVFRSDDTGGTFQRLSGKTSSNLPSGKAYDLVGDPGDVNDVYAAIGGSSGDVFFNGALGGGTWTALGLSDPALAAGLDTASNIKLAVGYDSGSGKSTLYAAVQDSSGQVVRLFRYKNAAWTERDQPQSVECGQLAGIKRNPQVEDLSIAVHPTSPDLVFLGGDGQPTGVNGVPGPDGDCTTDDAPASGRLLRCDASQPSGSQCTPIIGANTANYTGPHPDSRVIRFDANKDLLNGDDGGIYRRTSPKSSNGDWSSMNGHISISETHSCAWDHLLDVAFCGAQDNGTAQQGSPGAQAWKSIHEFDGGRVAVAYDSPSSTTKSVRYYSSQNLGGFTRDLCDSSGCTTSTPALTVSGSGGQSLNSTYDPNLPFLTPVAANAVDWQRLVIASTTVYESTDQGATVDVVPISAGASFGTATRALAYGGHSGTTEHKNVLYAGSTKGLFRRKPSESALSKTGYSGQPVDVTMDPSDWKSVWVIDGSTVKHSADSGDTWEDVTGNIAEAGAAQFRSVAFIPGPIASIIAVGAWDGVYVTNTAHLGHWSRITAGIPDAVALQLSYDAAVDRLAVATMGRGLWTMSQASEMDLPPVLASIPPGTANEGSAFTATGSFSDPNNGSNGEFYSVMVTYGDGGLDFPTIGPGGSFTLNHTYVDEGTYTVYVFVDDARGSGDVITTTVTVANVPPSVGPVTVAPSPAAVGTSVTASASFTDPGITDDHTGTIKWGDGSGATSATIGGSNTSGTASGSHAYTTPGLYPVTVTVTDEDGGVGSATYQYAIVYDPNGGYLTGSGWIDSPAGAYPANSTLTGKATFSFVSRYNGQTVPEGSTQFKFHAASFDFKATSYEWLVVSGAHAQYKGSGTVNGTAGYSFTMTAVDGAMSGGGGVDKIRLKVWDSTTGTVIYDTQPGASDTATPTTGLGAGTIVIHP